MGPEEISEEEEASEQKHAREDEPRATPCGKAIKKKKLVNRNMAARMSRAQLRAAKQYIRSRRGRCVALRRKYNAVVMFQRLLRGGGKTPEHVKQWLRDKYGSKWAHCTEKHKKERVEEAERVLAAALKDAGAPLPAQPPSYAGDWIWVGRGEWFGDMGEVPIDPDYLLLLVVENRTVENGQLGHPVIPLDQVAPLVRKLVALGCNPDHDKFAEQIPDPDHTILDLLATLQREYPDAGGYKYSIEHLLHALSSDDLRTAEIFLREVGGYRQLTDEVYEYYTSDSSPGKVMDGDDESWPGEHDPEVCDQLIERLGLRMWTGEGERERVFPRKPASKVPKHLLEQQVQQQLSGASSSSGASSMGPPLKIKKIDLSGASGTGSAQPVANASDSDGSDSDGAEQPLV